MAEMPLNSIIRLHRMHAMLEMQPVVTDDRGVCLSVYLVCLSFCLPRGSTRLHCAKTAERIKTLLSKGIKRPEKLMSSIAGCGENAVSLPNNSTYSPVGKQEK